MAYASNSKMCAVFKTVGAFHCAGRSVHERKYQGSSHVTTSKHDDMLVKE